MSLRSLLFPLGLVALFSACVADLELPAEDLVLSELPDINQDGPAYADRYNPMTLCAPVAVVNSLLWLGVNQGEAHEIEMVNTLASRDYMRTHHGVGTSPDNVMRGLSRYLEGAGADFRSITYRGWREVSPQFDDGGSLSLDWLIAGLAPGRATWLNIGWYERKFPGYYFRKGGHWVTLAGYRDGGLLVHDPGPWQLAPAPLQVREHRAWLLRSRFGTSAYNEVLLELVDSPAAQKGITMIEGAVRFEL